MLGSNPVSNAPESPNFSTIPTRSQNPRSPAYYSRVCSKRSKNWSLFGAAKLWSIKVLRFFIPSSANTQKQIPESLAYGKTKPNFRTLPGLACMAWTRKLDRVFLDYTWHFPETSVNPIKASLMYGRPVAAQAQLAMDQEYKQRNAHYETEASPR